VVVLIQVAVAAVCTGVAALVGGAEGALGAAVGGAVAIAFFASTHAVLGPMTRMAPGLSMLVALMFFATKMVGLLAVLVVLLDPDLLGARLDEAALGATVLAVALTVTVGRVVAHRRNRQLLYDLSERPR
jgi:ATP synthase protein I